MEEIKNNQLEIERCCLRFKIQKAEMVLYFLKKAKIFRYSCIVFWKSQPRRIWLHPIRTDFD
jgi:hypothetical protein